MEQEQRTIRYEKRLYIPEANLRVHYLMYAIEGKDRTVYDLEIRAIDSSGWDECSLRDVAVSSDMAKRIWLIFTRELVMPVTAEDILAELLSDAEFLYNDESG